MEEMNSRIGAVSKILTPSYSQCKRCKTTWFFVKPHTTWYKECYGMFPLCEKYWNELTPEQRLPYYEQLINEWGNVSIEDQKSIKEVVLKGK
jgi:hypothetical protein